MKTNKTKQMSQQKQHNKRSPDSNRPSEPVLQFSPTAWAKLLFFRDRGETEISGFGITDPDDLLYITDFLTIKQDATIASISLDDEAVADFFESQVDSGRQPQQFFRIWCHSHPGDSATPSGIDEATFARVFGKCDWAVMLIVAEDGKTYARLRFNVGPGGQILIPVHIDYSRPFGSSDRDAWEAEYKANIKVHSWPGGVICDNEILLDQEELDLSDYSLPQHILEELEEMEPAERRAVLNELTGRPDLWTEESEAMLYE